MHQDHLSKKKTYTKLITPESHERANMGSVVSDAVDSLPARGPLRSAAKLRRTGGEDLCRCRRHVALRYGVHRAALPPDPPAAAETREDLTTARQDGRGYPFPSWDARAPAWQSARVEAGRRRTKPHVYYGPQPCVDPGPNLWSGNFYEIFLTRL